MRTNDISALGAALLALSSLVQGGQREFQKLTVGWPISGAAIPLFIAMEEKLFQKYGYDISPVFLGGSPLINSAISPASFPSAIPAEERSSPAG